MSTHAYNFSYENIIFKMNDARNDSLECGDTLARWWDFLTPLSTLMVTCTL